MKNIEIIEIKFNSREYWEILRIRELVLRLPIFLRFKIEQIIQEQNEKIFGIKVDKKLVGSCQYIFSEDLKTAKMRQVCILKKFQGTGLGKKMILETETSCRNIGANIIQCHARKTAIPFYKSIGYQFISKEFEEVGIPHKKMEKRLI